MKGFSRVVVGAAGVALAFGLFACGDTIENQVNQTGLEVVASEDDLPECGKDNEGEQAVVKGESAIRVCLDGDWVAMGGEDGSDFSCKTVELKDKSGLKIVCNGDSIGVVLNGEKGETGKQGKAGESGTGCVITDRNDTAVVVTCGDSTMTIDLSVGLPNDTLEADSERTAISLDSLVGFTQKGPFLKGSTVYLYELSDGRTLKQTNGNFTSKITSDNGRYKFSARDLVSQYAMVVVDGYYRNEVTGGTSDAPIRLTALTDMRKRSSVNVNLLTHMEFDRVYNLVTRGDSTGKKLTVKAAKRQAQKEILKQFHIELGDNTDAEDMDVFGDSDADAALLAVSVLLQGDSNASALSVLLTEISNDIAGYGEWKNAATKAKLADWALTVDQADSTSRLKLFGENVRGWDLGKVPDFEKFVRNYASLENGLGICGSADVPEGKVKEVPNAKSDSYYAAGYTDTSKTKVRFVCRNEDSLYVWRAATNLEKDSAGWGHDGFAEGAVRKGQINTNLTYVYENGDWRHGTDLDDTVQIGCIVDRRDTVAKGKNDEWYKCIVDTTMQYVANEFKESGWKSAWRKANIVEKDTATWGPGMSGDVKRGNVTKEPYVYEGSSWRHGTDLEGKLDLGCTEARIDTLKRDLTGIWYKCFAGNMSYAGENGLLESVWYSEWREIKENEIDTSYWKLYKNTSGTLLIGPYSGDTLVWDADTLRKPTEMESYWNRGCVSYILGNNYELANQKSYYQCTENGWVFDKYLNTYSFTDSRDGKTYKAVTIGNQTWMAENLNYRYTAGRYTVGLDLADSTSFCYDNHPDSCSLYGRLYLWSAAMDSVGAISGNSANSCGYGYYCNRQGVRGVCPENWHLPSKAEWETLLHYVGETGVEIQTRLKATSGWSKTYVGTDDYAFTVLPTGYLDYVVAEGDDHLGGYKSRSSLAFFWTSTEYEEGSATQKTLMAYDISFSNVYSNPFSAEGRAKKYAYSVRCVRDY